MSDENKTILKSAAFYFALIILAFLVIGKIVSVQAKGEEGLNYSSYIGEETIDTLPPHRGSILASDGRCLAFSTPRYRVIMDCTVPDSSVFYNGIDSLALCLSESFGERTQKEYVSYIKSARANNKKYTLLLRQSVPYDTLQIIRKFPILRLGRGRGGFISEIRENREYPYGELAYMSIGFLPRDHRPTVGIECSMDSVLRGTEGILYQRHIDKRTLVQDVTKESYPAVNGLDVQSTIDIDIQDIATRALKNKISNEEDLQAGCAIVMEVATGAIRAMVSLSKDANGKFSESFDSYNYAIGYLGEPGSVFKLATLVTALEDKKVTLETEQRADVIWQFNKTKFEDTYLRNYSTITVAKGLEISSNNVFRRIAGEYYRHNPQEFVDKLNNERKISYNFDFDIPGLAKARINSPKDKHWSLTDLPQIGMGYAVKLTPLHILSFYNAIANNGVMVKPHIVENWQRNGVIEKEFPVETIGRVCSEKTAETARTALRGVVIGSNGTARNAFKNCKIDVAGKTGTARVALSHGYVDSKGHKRHQGSFVGFFPYENPKYSVIVVVHSCLSFKNFYGGTWGGPVAREIAETIYASSPEWGEHLSSGKTLPAVAEYKALSANDTIEGIPSVIGMGLREATYYLESRGYTVSSEGSGKVKSQSPAPGDTIANGDKKINILLSDNYEIK